MDRHDSKVFDKSTGADCRLQAAGKPANTARLTILLQESKIARRSKSETQAVLRKTFKYRLYPTKAQQESLRMQWSEACRLCNAALQERRDAYRSRRISLNYYTQANQLKEIRDAGSLALPNYHCAQDILRRLDKAFQAFFRRINTGQKPGFPRFKSSRRYDSITFPSHGDGNKLLERHLRVQGVGDIKIKLHRSVKGEIKTVSVKREANEWYVCFSVECESKPLPRLNNLAGIDAGLAVFADVAIRDDIAENIRIPNPRWYQEAEARLRRAQRRVARRKKSSNRRRKAIVLLQKVHTRIRRLRNEFHHRRSFKLISGFGTIGIENLNVKGLARGKNSKSAHDAGWASFFSKIAYKAESAGRNLIKVNPAGTSQTCVCGATVRKLLSDREHDCTECRLIAPRDSVSAQVIRQRARMVLQTST